MTTHAENFTAMQKSKENRKADERAEFEVYVDLAIEDLTRQVKNGDWGMAELTNKNLHLRAAMIGAEVVTYKTGGYSIYY